MIKEPAQRVDHLPGGFSKNRLLRQEIIVIHAISAVNVAPEDPYNYHRVKKILIDHGFSAHAAVTRAGEWVEWVPEHLVAWHAGKSRFGKHTWPGGINPFSLGVEVFGQQDQAFEPVQYETLAWGCARWADKFAIPTHKIVGHNVVSDRTVRPDPKWDPGRGFDWVWFGHLFMKMRTKK